MRHSEARAVRQGETVRRRLVSTAEAAEILGTTAGALREARSSGRLALPWVKLGRRGVRYDVRDLEAAIDAGRVQPGEGR